MSQEDAMAIDNSSLTPQQRLAVSRRALFGHLDRAIEHDESLHAHENTEANTNRTTQRKQGILAGLPWLAVAQSFGERWWRRHPANAVSQLARPMLQRYARKQPVKLVAMAAGTGALLVVIKPWRLLSVTAIVASVLKTSDVADMVTTLMHNNTMNRKDPYE
jgi:hypothetical protein